MAFAVRVIVVRLSIFFALLSFNFLSGSQGIEEDIHSPYKYPFIKKASSFSTPSPSSSSSQSSSSNGIDKAYDYIIIGGGTAGCPLAATLSRNFSVLLLERGGVPFKNYNVSYMQNFHLALADTSPTSASQAFISTDGVFNARARVLGGGTCINAGFYTRASSSEVKQAGWDSELVNESYPWVEKQIVRWPKLAPWQQAVRDGLLDIGMTPYNGYSYDHVQGTKVGGTIFDDKGRRSTAAELLASGNPQNLQVLIYATVQKIMFDKTGKRPKAVGVLFKDEKGKEHKAFLKKRKSSEVLLSSGAMGSPQMLLLSGIGSKRDLQKLNIQLIHHNVHVGKGMSDNPMNGIFVPTKKPVVQSLIQTVGITKKGFYIEASSGYGEKPDSIHRRHHGLMSAEIGQLSTVPPKERSSEAIQSFISKKRDLPHEYFQGGFMLSKLSRPLSKGQLSLVNTNVDDNPSVTFNYFSHPRDTKACVNAVRTMQKIVKSKNFVKLTKDDKLTLAMLRNMTVDANINLIPKHGNSSTSLAQFCKDTLITIWHYHGGCQVGKVVDSDYKVMGVDGLRVIDGSTFLVSPGTNPQATVMMLGRYMGVKILRGRLGRAGAGV
ncbi:hypothetical protein MKX01_001647 [Papaver californicum]|nr:hypothetical protein MKX01_001647 [Papaver californicum]